MNKLLFQSLKRIYLKLQNHPEEYFNHKATTHLVNKILIFNFSNKEENPLIYKLLSLEINVVKYKTVDNKVLMLVNTRQNIPSLRNKQQPEHSVEGFLFLLDLREELGKTILTYNKIKVRHLILSQIFLI